LLNSSPPPTFSFLFSFLLHANTRTVGVDGRIARLDRLEPRVVDPGEDDAGDEKVAAAVSGTGAGKNGINGKDEPDDGKPNEKDESAAKRQKLGDDGDKVIADDAGGAVAAMLDWKEVERELAEILGEGGGDDAAIAAAANAVARFLRRDDETTATTTTTPPSTDEEIAAATAAAATAPEEKSGGAYYVSLPPLQDKSRRRTLHEWIRRRLGGTALADTDNATKAVRIWKTRHASKMPNYGMFEQRKDIAGNGGSRRTGGGGGRDSNHHNNKKYKYIRFVLYKENMDTGTAVRQLERSIGGGNNSSNNNYGRNNNKRQRYQQQQQQQVRIGYAGMKDKRGVTSQFVTVPSNRRRDVLRLCERQQKLVDGIGSSNRGGGERPGNSGGGGGGGGGHTSSAGVALYRIGNLEYATDEISLGKLQGNRFDITLRNVIVAGAQGQNTTDTAETDSLVTKRCLEGAANALKRHGFINYFGMQRFGKYYDTHETGIAVLKGDYGAAVDIIMRPKQDEREQVQEARKQWQMRFKNCKDGDEDGRSVAEAECAKRILKQFGRFMGSEVSILMSSSRHPLDSKRAFMSISKTMRMMFVHAFQSYLWNHVASARVAKFGRHVVVGDLVHDSNSSGKDATVRVVSEADVSSNRYSIEDVVLPLVGTDTRYPENACGTLFAELLLKHGLTDDGLFSKVASDRQLDVKGDYRKLICHPKDVDFEIVEYCDPLEPLLQTDLMKIHNVELKQTPGAGLIAMNVGFTLPSSSYATIALRELMKTPTSSEYQKLLDVGGTLDE